MSGRSCEICGAPYDGWKFSSGGHIAEFCRNALRAQLDASRAARSELEAKVAGLRAGVRALEAERDEADRVGGQALSAAERERDAAREALRMVRPAFVRARGEESDPSWDCPRIIAPELCAAIDAALSAPDPTKAGE